jgi:hypothetical protein
MHDAESYVDVDRAPTGIGEQWSIPQPPGSELMAEPFRVWRLIRSALAYLAVGLGTRTISGTDDRSTCD